MHKEKFKIFGVAKKEKVVMCNDPNSIEHIFVDLKALSVPVWKSGLDVGSRGQPNLMKLTAEVGRGEIFQTPFGFCFPTFGLKVSGGGGGSYFGTNQWKSCFWGGMFVLV